MEQQKDNNTKYILIFAVIALLILCGWLISSLMSLKESSLEMQKKIATSSLQMKELEDSIVRSQSLYVTSEYLDQSLEDFNIPAIKKDLEDLNAKLFAINKILISTPGFYASNIPSTSTKPRPGPQTPENIPCIQGVCINPDKFNYLKSEQGLEINEPFSNLSVPFGTTSFKAWEEKPWSLQIFPRNYHSTTALSQDEEGNYIVHNKFEVEVKGRKYPISIQESKTLQQVSESEFWFNPKLYLGTGIGVNVTPELRAEVVPSVGVSLLSYGPNKKQSTFSFLNVGLGAHTQELSPAVVISPINYNVGEPLPLLDNLFVGPSVAIDVNANVSVSASVQVGL